MTVVHLRSAGTSFVLDARDAGMPAILHFGGDLGELTEPQLRALADSSVRAVPPSALNAPLRLGIVPLLADGWSGLPGLDGRHDPTPGQALRRPVLRLESVESSERSARVVLVDDADGDPVLRVEIDYDLSEHGVLAVRSQLTNTGSADFELSGLAAVLPLPGSARERLDFAGAWSAERVPQRAAIDVGTWLRESRHGRGGHDDAFVTAVGEPGFGFRRGEVWAAHLAWSGDSRVWIDRSALGFTALGAGELLAPGEIRLAPGETYAAPELLAAWSANGLDGISARFHSWVRALPAHPDSPRPLTLNTWEAVYFEHDLDRLLGLVELAAEVGVERFVLDDGWMIGRSDDLRALGDWTVDPESWPDGLHPLIDRVKSAGMQFGLWVEPEMVSLDSRLAREHPEWVLRETGDRLPESWRYQYVVDLAEDAAREHIRDALLALLAEYPIDYLKWDMNRDQLGGSAHRQVLATYRLMDELREHHPNLEIESCSSGGGRIDAGILQRTQRVWPSDTNDAHDRQTIMRWTSLLVPPEYLGAHVGAAPAHVTGRAHSLAFRLATALFGHAGIEWDLSATDPAERAALAAWAGAYRSLRGLVHSGAVVRGDEADAGETVLGVVAPDARDAVYWLSSLDRAESSARSLRRLPGLDPALDYRVEPVEFGADPAWYWGTPPPWWSDGGIALPGSVLAARGLELPMLLPDETVVVRVRAL